MYRDCLYIAPANRFKNNSNNIMIGIKKSYVYNNDCYLSYKQKTLNHILVSYGRVGNKSL